MAELEVSVYCYWNGCIKYGPEGVYYEGPAPKKIEVNPKIALNRLLDEMYVLTGVDVDKQRSKVKIFGRYPFVVGHSKFQYLLLPVVNNSSLETMLEVPSKHPSVKNVELYLEVKSEGVTGPAACSSKQQKTVKVERGSRTGNIGDAAVDADMTDNISGSNAVAQVVNLAGDDDHDLRVGLCFKDADELKKAVDWCSIKGLQKCVETSNAIISELQNWWKANNGYALETWEQAGSTGQKEEFETHIERIKKENPEARRRLAQIPQNQWALVHDSGRRYKIMEIDTKSLFAVCRGFELADHAVTGSVMLLFDELRDRFDDLSHFSRGSLNSGHVYTKPVTDKLEEFRTATYVDNCYTYERSYKTYAATFSPIPELAAWPEASGVPRLFPPVILPPPSNVSGFMIFAHCRFDTDLYRVLAFLFRIVVVMAEREIKVLCYSDGGISRGPDGFYSEGSIPKEMMRVKQNTNFTTFLDEIYLMTGLDKETSSNLRIFCRYPSLVSQPMVTFGLLPVTCDGDLERMLEVPSNHPSFFLELQPFPPAGFSWPVENPGDRGELKKAVDWRSIRGQHKCVVKETGKDEFTFECIKWKCRWSLRAVRMEEHGPFEITSCSGPDACKQRGSNACPDDFDEEFLAYEVEGVAGSSTQKAEFDSYMKDIKEKSPEGWKWLDRIPPHQWALAHDSGLRYGVMMIDRKALFAVCRSFQKVAMTGGVMLLFSEMKDAFDVSFSCSRGSLHRGDVYTENVMRKFQESLIGSGAYVVTPLERDAFKVSGPSERVSMRHLMEKYKEYKECIVELNDSTCTCGKFQRKRFPCLHALAVFQKMKINPLPYVDDCYFAESYYKTYEATFSSVPEMSAWPEASGVRTLFPPVIAPPPLKVSGKGKGKSKSKEPPSDEELRNAILDILKVMDFKMVRTSNTIMLYLCYKLDV
ncbi:hypothetical protein F2Q70_00001448 [Brassica cretica]|uniref:SWIM-type domain-containing protein n=1 Tax=Brassica cretica TaxID=69181 RepID=A0A8S9J4D2_BRACR|nr:hypothetical protein F2Q70_00001448 [Brassica cretica]